MRGHSGSVMALAVFEGMHEYVTGGYDRCGAPDATSPNAISFGEPCLALEWRAGGLECGTQANRA